MANAAPDSDRIAWRLDMGVTAAVELLVVFIVVFIVLLCLCVC